MHQILREIRYLKCLLKIFKTNQNIWGFHQVSWSQKWPKWHLNYTIRVMAKIWHETSFIYALLKSNKNIRELP